MTGEEYRQGALDLLGLIGYGELAAFEQLAQDAALAPTLEDRVKIATLASAQLMHFRRVSEHARQLGGDPMAAMEPFHAAFDSYHAHTVSKGFFEGLVKTVIGGGLARDFYAEIAPFVRADTREVVHQVLAGATEFDSEEVEGYLIGLLTGHLEREPSQQGRLALYGRRLMGEALSHAQRVATDRPSLTLLLSGRSGAAGMDLAAVSRMFSRLTDQHSNRMFRLGLTP